MDRKRIAKLILISVFIVSAWFTLNRWAVTRHPEWFEPPTPEKPAATSQPTTAPGLPAPVTQATRPSATTIRPTGQPATAEGGLQARPTTRAAETRSIGYLDFDKAGKSEWPLALEIEPNGAGLKSATLNRYRAQVDKDEPYVFQQPDAKAADWAKCALAARSISIDGGDWIDVATVPWNLVEHTADSASYSIDIVRGNAKVLSISKTYTLRKKTDQNEGFEFDLKYSFASADGQEHKVRMTFNGPNVPPVENSRDVPEIVLGYDEGGKYVAFDHYSGSVYQPDNPERPQDSTKTLADPKKRPILWAGITSAYFDGIVLDEQQQIAELRVFAAAKPDEISGQEYLVLTFLTDELKVPAAKGQATDMRLQVYIGPRQREILTSAYYAAYPRGYDDTIVITGKGIFGWICGLCTWGWLINFLVVVLKGFHFVLRDWGLAIMLLVIIVRLLLHPITKRSQISMQKMTKLGPEMEKLKKKFGDDKEGLQRAQMELYKEQGFTPILGCLPMFLQMPIWIALWSALQGTFELRHSSFLWGFTWIKDLAQQDRLWYFPNNVKIWAFHIDALNVLPILMGVVFYLQQKMTPKPAAETPEQAQQRKMMSWVSLLFPIILYNGPAGLNLYILASTAIGIWESKRVRDHIKAQEEAERAGKVIVDAKATRGAKKHARADQPDQPKGGLRGWLAHLQKRTEQMRDEADKKKRPKR